MVQHPWFFGIFKSAFSRPQIYSGVLEKVLHGQVGILLFCNPIAPTPGYGRNSMKSWTPDSLKTFAGTLFFFTRPANNYEVRFQHSHSDTK